MGGTSWGDAGVKYNAAGITGYSGVRVKTKYDRSVLDAIG